MRDPRQEDRVEVVDHCRERLGIVGRGRGQRRPNRAGLDLREHRELACALEVRRDPLERERSVLPEVAHFVSFLTSRHERVFRICSFGEPGAPRLRDPELRVAQGADRVRVRRDRDPDARLARQARMRVAHVEAVGLGVDLERRAGLDRVRHHPLDVDRRAVTLQQPAARQVPDAVDVRVVHGADDPLRRAAVERGVQRCDDPVELRKNCVVDVERSVRADVHLDAA